MPTIEERLRSLGIEYIEGPYGQPLLRLPGARQYIGPTGTVNPITGVTQTASQRLENLTSSWMQSVQKAKPGQALTPEQRYALVEREIRSGLEQEPRWAENYPFAYTQQLQARRASSLAVTTGEGEYASAWELTRLKGMEGRYWRPGGQSDKRDIAGKLISRRDPLRALDIGTLPTIPGVVREGDEYRFGAPAGKAVKQVQLAAQEKVGILGRTEVEASIIAQEANRPETGYIAPTRFTFGVPTLAGQGYSRRGGWTPVGTTTQSVEIPKEDVPRLELNQPGRTVRHGEVISPYSIGGVPQTFHPPANWNEAVLQGVQQRKQGEKTFVDLEWQLQGGGMSVKWGGVKSQVPEADLERMMPDAQNIEFVLGDVKNPRMLAGIVLGAMPTPELQRRAQALGLPLQAESGKVRWGPQNDPTLSAIYMDYVTKNLKPQPWTETVARGNLFPFVLGRALGALPERVRERVPAFLQRAAIPGVTGIQSQGRGMYQVSGQGWSLDAPALLQFRREWEFGRTRLNPEEMAQMWENFPRIARGLERVGEPMREPFAQAIRHSRYMAGEIDSPGALRDIGSLDWAAIQEEAMRFAGVQQMKDVPLTMLAEMVGKKWASLGEGMVVPTSQGERVLMSPSAIRRLGSNTTEIGTGTSVDEVNPLVLAHQYALQAAMNMQDAPSSGAESAFLTRYAEYNEQLIKFASQGGVQRRAVETPLRQATEGTYIGSLALNPGEIMFGRERLARMWPELRDDRNYALFQRMLDQKALLGTGHRRPISDIGQMGGVLGLVGEKEYRRRKGALAMAGNEMVVSQLDAAINRGDFDADRFLAMINAMVRFGEKGPRWSNARELQESLGYYDPVAKRYKTAPTMAPGLMQRLESQRVRTLLTGFEAVLPGAMRGRVQALAASKLYAPVLRELGQIGFSQAEAKQFIGRGLGITRWLGAGEEGSNEIAKWIMDIQKGSSREKILERMQESFASRFGPGDIRKTTAHDVQSKALMGITYDDIQRALLPSMPTEAAQRGLAEGYQRALDRGDMSLGLRKTLSLLHSWGATGQVDPATGEARGPGGWGAIYLTPEEKAAEGLEGPQFVGGLVGAQAHIGRWLGEMTEFSEAVRSQMVTTSPEAAAAVEQALKQGGNVSEAIGDEFPDSPMGSYLLERRTAERAPRMGEYEILRPEGERLVEQGQARKAFKQFIKSAGMPAGEFVQAGTQALRHTALSITQARVIQRALKQLGGAAKEPPKKPQVSVGNQPGPKPLPAASEALQRRAKRVWSTQIVRHPERPAGQAKVLLNLLNLPGGKEAGAGIVQHEDVETKIAGDEEQGIQGRGYAGIPAEEWRKEVKGSAFVRGYQVVTKADLVARGMSLEIKPDTGDPERFVEQLASGKYILGTQPYLATYPATLSRAGKVEEATEQLLAGTPTELPLPAREEWEDRIEAVGKTQEWIAPYVGVLQERIRTGQVIPPGEGQTYQEQIAWAENQLRNLVGEFGPASGTATSGTTTQATATPTPTVAATTAPAATRPARRTPPPVAAAGGGGGNIPPRRHAGVTAGGAVPRPIPQAGGQQPFNVGGLIMQNVGGMPQFTIPLPQGFDPQQGLSGRWWANAQSVGAKISEGPPDLPGGVKKTLEQTERLFKRLNQELEPTTKRLEQFKEAITAGQKLSRGERRQLESDLETWGRLKPLSQHISGYWEQTGRRFERALEGEPEAKRILGLRHRLEGMNEEAELARLATSAFGDRYGIGAGGGGRGGRGGRGVRPFLADLLAEFSIGGAAIRMGVVNRFTRGTVRGWEQAAIPYEQAGMGFGLAFGANYDDVMGGSMGQIMQYQAAQRSFQMGMGASALQQRAGFLGMLGIQPNFQAGQIAGGIGGPVLSGLGWGLSTGIVGTTGAALAEKAGLMGLSGTLGALAAPAALGVGTAVGMGAFVGQAYAASTPEALQRASAEIAMGVREQPSFWTQAGYAGRTAIAGAREEIENKEVIPILKQLFGGGGWGGLAKGLLGRGVASEYTKEAAQQLTAYRGTAQFQIDKASIYLETLEGLNLDPAQARELGVLLSLGGYTAEQITAGEAGKAINQLAPMAQLGQAGAYTSAVERFAGYLGIAPGQGLQPFLTQLPTVAQPAQQAQWMMAAQLLGSQGQRAGVSPTIAQVQNYASMLGAGVSTIQLGTAAQEGVGWGALGMTLGAPGGFATDLSGLVLPTMGLKPPRRPRTGMELREVARDQVPRTVPYVQRGPTLDAEEYNKLTSLSQLAMSQMGYNMMAGGYGIGPGLRQMLATLEDQGVGPGVPGGPALMDEQGFSLNQLALRRLGWENLYAGQRYQMAQWDLQGRQTQAAWANTQAQQQYQMGTGAWGGRSTVGWQFGLLGQIDQQQALMEFTKALRGITHEIIGVQRAQQLRGLERAQEGLELSVGQQVESWGLSRRMWLENVQFQRAQMGVQWGQMQTRQGWQTQDFAWNRQMAGFQYGYQRDELERAIRMATGREKAGLLRRRDYMEEMYSRQEDRRGVEEDRAKQVMEWDRQRFHAQREHFERVTQLQQEQFDMQLRHILERYEFEKERIEEQKRNLQELWALEDKARKLQEDWQDKQQQYQLEELKRQRRYYEEVVFPYQKQQHEFQVEAQRLQREYYTKTVFPNQIKERRLREDIENAHAKYMEWQIGQYKSGGKLHDGVMAFFDEVLGKLGQANYSQAPGGGGVPEEKKMYGADLAQDLFQGVNLQLVLDDGTAFDAHIEAVQDRSSFRRKQAGDWGSPWKGD